MLRLPARRTRLVAVTPGHPSAHAWRPGCGPHDSTGHLRWGCPLPPVAHSPRMPPGSPPSRKGKPSPEHCTAQFATRRTPVRRRPGACRCTGPTSPRPRLWSTRWGCDYICPTRSARAGWRGCGNCCPTEQAPLPVRQWRPRGSSARGTRSALTAIDHRHLAPGPPASRSTTELTTNPSRKTHHEQDCPHRRRAVSRRADINAHRRRRAVRPVQRRADDQPTQGRRLHRHRQQSRRRPGRPVHRRRGPCRPDLQPVGFRNARSPRRHPHHLHRQDRIRRPRLLSSHARGIPRGCCPAAIALSCRRGRLRPPQGLLGQNIDAAPIITVIADALEHPPTKHATPILHARPTSWSK